MVARSEACSFLGWWWRIQHEAMITCCYQSCYCCCCSWLSPVPQNMQCSHKLLIPVGCCLLSLSWWLAELMPFLLPGRVFTSWKLLTIAAMLAKCYCSSCLSLLFFCSKCHIPHQLHLIWFKVSWTITSRISAVQPHLSSPFWKQSQQEFQLLNCIVIV